MKNRLYLLILFIGLVSYSTISAQLQLGFHADAGVSNFIEKNREPNVEIANNYTSLFSYSLGVSTSYPIVSDWLRINSGAKYAQLRAMNNMPKDMPKDMPFPGNTPSSWEEQYHTLQIPIKVDYAFEKWLHFNLGLSNKINLNTPKNTQTEKINKYALAFIGGFDFIFYDKFILGASYYKDLTPNSLIYKNYKETNETYDIGYYVQQCTINIGYLLDFNRK